MILHASVQSLVSQQPAAPLLFHDLPKTSTLDSSDPITLSRLQTDTKNSTLWENASSSSAVRRSVLITDHGLYGNWFELMTILWVASNTAVFSSALPLRSFTLLVVVALRRLAVVCVLDVLRKITDLLGLGPCNRLMAVRNLLWHHQIHDQPLISLELRGVWGLERALLSCNHF